MGKLRRTGSVFLKVNAIEKGPTRLIKRREYSQTTNIKNEIEDITLNPTDIKRWNLKRGYYEQLYTNNFNINKIGKFLTKYQNWHK